MIPILEAPRSFAATRWMSRTSLNRRRFKKMQTRQLQAWLRRDVPKVAFYRGTEPSLSALPIIDKATLMADFAAFNTAGLSAETVREAIMRDCRVGNLTVGASTGTSGNRGFFVISDAERFRWLGTILAKTIPDLLWQPQRIAVLLPQGTALYDSVNKLRRLQLRFFDLHERAETWQPHLEQFDPTIIVAPPRVLRLLAETGTSATPQRVFSAAETLDSVDRPVIEARFGAPLKQIYMATEGLLATTCQFGKLHLAEDSIHFEFEHVGEGLVSPLITSFRRRIQIMARYRMNDLLRLDPEPCSCGSPLQAVHEIVGRMDDCFRLVDANGTTLITPDVMRNAVLDAHPAIDDFRLIQTTVGDIELILPPTSNPQVLDAAKARLDTLLQRRASTARLAARIAPLPLDPSRKLRRVECRVKPQ